MFCPTNSPKPKVVTFKVTWNKEETEISQQQLEDECNDSGDPPSFPLTPQGGRLLKCCNFSLSNTFDKKLQNERQSHKYPWTHQTKIGHGNLKYISTGGLTCSKGPRSAPIPRPLWWGEFSSSPASLLCFTVSSSLLSAVSKIVVSYCWWKIQRLLMF